MIIGKLDADGWKIKEVEIPEVNGVFYVTGLVFSDGSSLFYGPFATKEEAESKIK